MNISIDDALNVLQPIEYRPNKWLNCLKGGEMFNMLPNAGKEYACFAIWEDGRSKEDEILDELKKNFDVVADFLIFWSDEHYQRNIQRLYQRPAESERIGYDKKIGKPPFRFVIVEDPNPSYTWMKSVSGVVEPSNRNVVRKKYEFRSWFEKQYQVHSSNNLGEFYFQAILILGKELLRDSLMSRDNTVKEIHRDLEGADGWSDWGELFSVLNTCSNYLVLRNFDNLPKDASDGDVDFLCDNFQWLASAANIYQNKKKHYKGVVEVAGSRIPIDIRFVGDGYYPTAWQKDMMRRKVFVDGIYVPAVDDLFFTILYHCKIHKKTVNAKYRVLLADIAEKMNLDWFSEVDIYDDAEIGKLLRGYMLFNNYYYERPVDRGVYENKGVARVVNQSFFVNDGVPPWIGSIKKRIRPLLLLRRRMRLYLSSLA